MLGRRGFLGRCLTILLAPLGLLVSQKKARPEWKSVLDGTPRWEHLRLPLPKLGVVHYDLLVGVYLNDDEEGPLLDLLYAATVVVDEVARTVIADSRAMSDDAYMAAVGGLGAYVGPFRTQIVQLTASNYLKWQPPA